MNFTKLDKSMNEKQRCACGYIQNDKNTTIEEVVKMLKERYRWDLEPEDVEIWEDFLEKAENDEVEELNRCGYLSDRGLAIGKAQIGIGIIIKELKKRK